MAAIVKEAEAADLVAHEAEVAVTDRGDLRHPEHSYLLIEIAQVRDLERLRLGLCRVAAIRAEEARRRDAELRVAGRVGCVAALAAAVKGRDHRLGHHVEEEVSSGLLIRGERVVKLLQGVGRIGKLQGEVGERLHVAGWNLFAAAEQTRERHLERPERGALVEGAAVRLRRRGGVASGAIAAPVHRAMIGHAAQALRGHGTGKIPYDSLQANTHTACQHHQNGHRLRQSTHSKR